MKRQLPKDKARALAKKLGLPAGPLSFSQISTYTACPKSYEFQYVKQVKRVGISETMTLGSCMHVGLETLLRQKMEGQPFDLPRAYRAMDTSLLDSFKKDPELPRQVKMMMRRQLKCLNDMLKYWHVSHMAGYNPTGVEEKIFAIVGDVPTIMKIDLIDNNETVYDHKLTKTFKKKDNAKSSLQLSMYSIATGIRRAGFISFRYPNLTLKKKWKPELEAIVVQKKRGELEWAEEVVGGIFKGIMSGVYPPCDPASWKCSVDWCDWFPICRGETTARDHHVPKWASGFNL